MPRMCGAFFISDMNKEACYKIGYIAKTHGLKGEVTAVITEPIDLASVTSVFLEVNSHLVPYFIAHFSDRQDKVFIKFEEVSTPELADQLKGASIYLDKSARPKLARGAFYDDEIIGFVVEDISLGTLGTVSGIIKSGSTRLIQVNHANKEILIPVNGPFITSLNKTKKRIGVALPEGFLEI
ncbi:MAG: 16S rRNA processing protein RimM [Cyclobacteriaceae bacterium]|nr:16S rRNA processing protein RimM [Cyclobacteriaceae bacterium]